ncbi:hypothetical protein Pelo_17031 [Pelomyxa schiedti]|nr:hypothetical protein Pelo_17031 [Pelomyxa schiedti]
MHVKIYLHSLRGYTAPKQPRHHWKNQCPGTKTPNWVQLLHEIINSALTLSVARIPHHHINDRTSRSCISLSCPDSQTGAKVAMLTCRTEGKMMLPTDRTTLRNDDN